MLNQVGMMFIAVFLLLSTTAVYGLDAELVVDVETLEFNNDTMTIDLNYHGLLRSSKVVDVIPQVSGLLLKKIFEEGSYVDKGEGLYQIEDTPFRLELDNAVSHYKIEKANYALSVDEYKRAEELYKNKSMSKTELSNYALKRNLALAAYEQAVTAQRFAEYQLTKTLVKSPISGYTEVSLKDVGSYVEEGSTHLVRVRNNDFYYVDFNVPEVDYDRFSLYTAFESQGKEESNIVFYLLNHRKEKTKMNLTQKLENYDKK